MGRVAMATLGAALIATVACDHGNADPPAAPPPIPTPGDAAAAVDPGSTRWSLETRCAEPCLWLTDAPLDQLATIVHARCGKDLEPAFTSDCKTLDYARNCIFASHGMVFRKKKWAVWKTKPWYRPRAEFRAKELSALELANVHELRLRGKACRKGVTVSSQDQARAQAWLAELATGAPPMPALVFVDSEAASAAELIAQGHPLVAKLAKDTAMSYGELPSGVNVREGAKLRTIVIEVPGTLASAPCDDDCDPGSKLALVYSDRDELVGVSLELYAW